MLNRIAYWIFILLVVSTTIQTVYMAFTTEGLGQRFFVLIMSTCVFNGILVVDYVLNRRKNRDKY